MGKAPAFQFYPGDWLKNTRHLSLQAKGAWIDILSLMWDSENKGKLSLSWKALARAIGTSIKSTQKVVNELVETGVCDMDQNVTCNANVTKCNNDVTLINRRMYREAQNREQARLRVKKHRMKQVVTPICNANVTAPSSSSSSSSTSKRIKDMFDSFWNAYPKNARIGKKKARAAFEKLKPSEELLNTMLKALKRQTEWRMNAKPGEFRPEWAHPTTWLNGERWNDEIIVSDSEQKPDSLKHPVWVICPNCNHKYDLRHRDKNSRYPGCPKCRVIWLISIEDEIKQRQKAAEAKQESVKYKQESGPRLNSQPERIGDVIDEAMIQE